MQNSPIALLAALLFFAACSQEKPEAVQLQADPVENAQRAEDEGVAYYLVPAPNELFSLIEGHVEMGQLERLNPVENVEKYADATHRALNFGVFATDLIYTSRGENSVEVIRYFVTVKKMAEEMGIASAFEDKVFRQLEADVTTGDSLKLISLEAYYRAYESLEQNEKGTDLALLVTGGWLESLYMTMASMDSFEPGGVIEQAIADQKYTLDNLIELNLQYNTSVGSIDVLAMLEGIRGIFDGMDVVPTNENTESSSGRMILGGTETVRMDAEQYQDLRQAIISARQTITMNEEV